MEGSQRASCTCCVFCFYLKRILFIQEYSSWLIGKPRMNPLDLAQYNLRPLQMGASPSRLSRESTTFFILKRIFSLQEYECRGKLDQLLTRVCVPTWCDYLSKQKVSEEDGRMLVNYYGYPRYCAP